MSALDWPACLHDGATKSYSTRPGVLICLKCGREMPSRNRASFEENNMSSPDSLPPVRDQISLFARWVTAHVIELAKSDTPWYGLAIVMPEITAALPQTLTEGNPWIKMLCQVVCVSAGLAMKMRRNNAIANWNAQEKSNQ